MSRVYIHKILTKLCFMASINFNSNFIAICVDSCIYLLRRNEDIGRWNYLFEIDLNLLELNIKKEENNQNKAKKAGDNKHIILCSSLSNQFLTVATNTKLIVLFDFSTILFNYNDCPKAKSLLHSIQELPKAPAEVYLSRNNDIIFLSDRSGSIYEFKIEENGISKGQELLGHLSMLLDFCFSLDGKYILTADRDEKIRVSRYPQTFVIENFCLGSTSFVKTISCLDDSLAVSAGGDSFLRLWNFKNGICLFTSSKICDAPIRKIKPLKIKNSTRIVVLPDGRNSIFLFELNKEDQTLSLFCSIRCEDIDEKFHDFCIDSDREIVYCLGRKHIYYCEVIGSGEMELRPINENCDAKMWTNLAECEDKYPLDELYRTVHFGNVENYQKTKKAKIEETNSRKLE